MGMSRIVQISKKNLHYFDRDILLKELFDNYSKKLNYAKSIKYEDTIDAIKQIIEILDSKIIDV